MNKEEQNRIRVACIGDSITYGSGVEGEDYENSTWEYFLQQKLGERYEVLNYGIGGRTLQKEGDYPYSEFEFYNISHEIQAEIYIIMLGTNDSKPFNWNFARYKAQLPPFVEGYKEHANHPRVILMAPSKCFADACDISNGPVEKEIHPFILEYAKESGTECIDLYVYSEHHPEWFVDGVHPNVKGNQAFAKRIFEQIVGQES